MTGGAAHCTAVAEPLDPSAWSCALIYYINEGKDYKFKIYESVFMSKMCKLLAICSRIIDFKTAKYLQNYYNWTKKISKDQ